MNLSSIIDRGALNFADKIALVHGSKRYTYDRLKRAVDRIAFYLREQGIRSGGLNVFPTEVEEVFYTH